MKSKLLIILLGLCLAGNAWGHGVMEEIQAEELADLQLFFEEQELVVTPTKTAKTVRNAPSIVSVITAREIRNMGARDLADILRTIPGFGIQISQGYGRSEIEVRGVGTRNSEKVLVLIDGHKINNLFFGGATTFTTDMPVDNIKKIEVIRGPGSALYGANAFLAVINIITKKAEDIKGVQLTAGGGSYDTYRYNILFGKQPAEKFKISGSANHFSTNGADLLVAEDFLSADPQNAPISMAPDKTDRWVERYDLGLNLSYGDIFFNGNFMELQHGAAIGVRNALSDDTEMKYRQFFTELGIEHSFNKNSDILVKVYYDQFDFDLFFELFPEGYKFKNFEFPDGLLTQVGVEDRTVGVNLQWDYRVFKNNRLMLGYIHEYIKQDDVKTQANFDTNTPGVYLDDPPYFKNVTDIHAFNKDKPRRVSAFYAQDDWAITDYLSLVLGIRYDKYSDFGDALSPRTGIILQPLEGLDIKLLYGRAFRAPSFEELYNQNNVAVVGNDDLDAETLDTYEAGVGYLLSENYRLRINYFHTEINDLIVLGPTISGTIAREYENLDEVEIDGLEFEFKAQYSQDNYGYLNLSFQAATDKKTGEDLADVPESRGNVGVNLGLTKYLNLNTHVFYSGKRPRVENDFRDELPSYGVVDVTLIAKEFMDTLEIRAAVHNLLDKDYADPALPTLVDDEPQPGINYILEASYTF